VGAVTTKAKQDDCLPFPFGFSSKEGVLLMGKKKNKKRRDEKKHKGKQAKKVLVTEYVHVAMKEKRIFHCVRIEAFDSLYIFFQTFKPETVALL
jgi:hypothetical protein